MRRSNHTGYAEGRARTNKLHCSNCGRSIKKGEQAYFYLDNGCMEDAYCEEHMHEMDNNLSDYGDNE